MICQSLLFEKMKQKRVSVHQNHANCKPKTELERVELHTRGIMMKVGVEMAAHM